jgi:hypothetical protein
MGDEEIDFLVLPPEDRRLLPKFKSVGRPFYRNPAN